MCQVSPTLKGQQPRHSPNVKSQLGGPQEEGGQDQNSFWPGCCTGGKATGCFSSLKHSLAPHMSRVEDSDHVSSLLGTPVLLHLCHRGTPSPSSQPSHFMGSQITSIPPEFLGYPRTYGKGQTPLVPSLPHPFQATAPPHMLLIPAVQAGSRLPAITQTVPAAQNAHPLSVSLT